MKSIYELHSYSRVLTSDVFYNYFKMFLQSYNYTWTGFHSKEELRTLPTSKPVSAVYMWGWFNQEHKFIPFYLGKHHSLHQRLFQHIGNLAGGLYTVYEKDEVLSGKFRPSHIDPLARPVYSPKGIAHWLDNFMSPKVQDLVKWYVENIRFAWIETDPVDNLYLEKYVANRLANNGIFVSSLIRGYQSIQLPQRDISFCGNEAIVNMLI